MADILEFQKKTVSITRKPSYKRQVVPQEEECESRTTLWLPEDLLKYVLEHKKNIDRIVIGFRMTDGSMEAVANTSNRTEVIGIVGKLLEGIK